MGDSWIRGNIKKMIDSGNPDLINLGKILEENQGLINRYVSGIDKTSETVKIIKLNKLK